MQYTTLGNTDIKVSKICVGCMSFGEPGSMHQWTLDQDGTDAVVAEALDMGLNFFDTANVYSKGTSEEYLGNALRKSTQRDKVVIASKVYFNPGRLSSKAIHHEIDGTLKRLGTDYLDLYIIHRFDYDTPIEETMEALNDLIEQGKVRAIGASAMYGYQFFEMQIAARQQLGTVPDDGGPLQPAVSRRRARAHPDLQADERLADAVLAARRRPPDAPHMGRGHTAQRDRPGAARQIRQRQE